MLSVGLSCGRGARCPACGPEAKTYAYAYVLACCQATEFDFLIFSSFDVLLWMELESGMHSLTANRKQMAGGK